MKLWSVCHSHRFESRTQMISCIEIEVTSKLSLLNATVDSRILKTRLVNSEFIHSHYLSAVVLIRYFVLFTPQIRDIHIQVLLSRNNQQDATL